MSGAIWEIAQGCNAGSGAANAGDSSRKPGVMAVRYITSMRYLSFLALLCAVLSSAASDKGAEIPKRAIEQSQITLPGSQPFHLRAKVLEATNKNNEDYRAEIEEYWAAPNKWRRTVTTPTFSQTLIVNGDKVSEELKGDYYPNWLHTLVDATFDQQASLKDIDLDQSDDNPRIGGKLSCRRFAFRAGVPPQNNVFSTFCFDGTLLESVGKPGYYAQYLSYRKFGEKKVAHHIREYLEPGTELEENIEELDSWTPDEAMLSVKEAGEQLQTLILNEAVLRKLAPDAPEMKWPPIHGGKAAGVLSIYVCLDRDGKIRETYGLNSDHPEMTDAAQKQLRSWNFKKATSHGMPVQVNGILTFAYVTKLVK
ncbi:MAG: hypothetical protein JWO13_3274 [Acidobacteriales bacterium]|nr:hypothetical protein [Terriglobales bacterium]